LESQSLALLAREVFVGTLATIYSVGSTGNEDTIKMAAEVNPITERRCSTRIRDLIIVVLCFCLAMCQYDRDNEKETNSWKWPLGNLS
jgi:ferrous iron transport protein B